MKSFWSTLIRWAIVSAVAFGTTSALAVHPTTPGYHPQAAAYPFQYGQGQITPGWGQRETATFDMGDTCCGPHWYDAFVEGLILTRVGSDRMLSTIDIPGFGPRDSALSTEDAGGDWEPAVRAGIRWQLSAVTSVEADYLDALTYNGHAAVFTSNHNLYSFFSDFGNDPFGGYEEVDQATRHAVTFHSDLDNVNVHWRHDWTSPGYNINGAWIFGIRYTKIDEGLSFSSLVRSHVDPINMVDRPTRDFQYDIAARNEMVGPQFGGEFVRCLTPGLLFSLKTRGALMLNFAEQESVLTGTTLGTLNEAADDDDIAFATEIGARLIYQFHPLWKVRVGYEMLFLSGVATGTSNLNAQSPFGNSGIPRIVDIEMDDTLLFHGGVFGIEFGW